MNFMNNLIRVTLIFFILNFLNIAKSEILEGFCLVKRSDLEMAKIAKDDYSRFLGKEIKFLVSFDEGLLADVSEDGELSVITGMYGGVLEFKQNGLILNYENKIEVGEKETDQVTYSYKNKLSLVDNKITSLYAEIDQTGFSMNNWKFQIDCRDYPYTEDEKLAAKDPKIIECPKGMSKALCQLMKNKELAEQIQKYKIDAGAITGNYQYSILIEEDFDTVLFLKIPPTYGKANREVTIISYGGYEFFKGVYDRTDNLADTFVQPAEMSKNGEMEDYMKEGFQANFVWEFKERNQDQIVISRTDSFVRLIESYVASDSPFSISSITDEFWYAATFDLVKNNEDLLKIYQKNKSTYCSLIKEDFVTEASNLELQYNHKDFIDFNNRNNIDC